MSKLIVNVGSGADTGDGDTLRVAFIKTVSNVDELYLHAESTSNPHNTTAAQVGAVALTSLGVATGVATLNATGQLLSSQKPVYAYSEILDRPIGITYNATANQITLADGAVTVGANLIVQGNLTVAGLVEHVNSVTIDIEDNFVRLNAGIASNAVPTLDAGIEIARGAAAPARFLWDEALDAWTPSGGRMGNIAQLTANSIIATSLTGALSGNAATATKLQSERTIILTGAVMGSGNFDGASNLNLTTTMPNSGVIAGTYGSNSSVGVFTVDSKGLITHATSVGIGSALQATPAAIPDRIVERDADAGIAVRTLRATDISLPASVAVSFQKVVGTSPTVIDSFAISQFRSAKYLLSVTSPTNYQASEVLLIHNNTDAAMVEYGAISVTGEPNLVTYATDVSNGSVRLLANTVSGAATIKLVGTRVTCANEVITLAALTLSDNDFYTDEASGAVIGTLTNATPGSILTIVPSDNRVAISGDALVIGSTPSTVGTFGVIVRETIEGVSNSPRDTLLNLTVALRPIITRTADGSVGQTYTVTNTTSRQWGYSDGSDIAGANAATYVATADDVGKTLVVKVGNKIVATAPGPVLTAPVVIWSMDTLTGVTTNGATNFDLAIDGTAIMQTWKGKTGSPYLQKTGLAVAKPSHLDVLAIRLRLDEQPLTQNISSIEFRPGANNVYYAAPPRTVNDTVLGDLWHAIPVSQMATFSGLPEATIDGRVVLGSNGAGASPYIAKPRIDYVAAKAGGMPTYCLTIDGGRASVHDWLLPALVARRLKATLYCTTDNMIGAPYMTPAQVKAWSDAGMSVGITATSTGAPVTAFADPAAVVADIQTQWDWLEANGISMDAKHHFSYPEGVFREASARVVATATSDGGNTLVLDSVVGIAVGMAATGYQIPAGATVVSINVPAQSVTLSAAVAAQTGLSVVFADTASPFFTGRLQTALRAFGMRTGRTALNGTSMTRFGFAGQGLMLPQFSLAQATSTTMNSYVDQAKNERSTVITTATNFANNSTSGNTHQAAMETHLDYLAQEVEAGRLAVLTMAELWNRDGNASFPNSTNGMNTTDFNNPLNSQYLPIISQ